MLFLAAMTGSASAQYTPEQRAELQRACSGDYSRLCSQIDPNAQARIAQCFQSQFDRVSQRCKSAINKTR